MKPLPIFCRAVILAALAFSCNKSADQITKTALKDEKQLGGNAGLLSNPVDCNYFQLMGWQSADVLSGTWGGVNFVVNSPTYRVYCDNGQTVVLSNGQPFFGSSMGVDYTQNTMVIEAPSSSSNQFVIIQGTISNENIAKYMEGTRKFRADWHKFLDNPSLPMPVIDEYLPKGVPNVRNITGKLIRVTSGTNFAVAPSCHPYTQTCTDAPINTVGSFTHWVYDEFGLPDYGMFVWVSIDPSTTDPITLRSQIVAGKFMGSSITYPASGTYIPGPRRVENFSMNTPNGPVTYTGRLTRP